MNILPGETSPWKKAIQVVLKWEDKFNTIIKGWEENHGIESIRNVDFSNDFYETFESVLNELYDDLMQSIQNNYDNIKGIGKNEGFNTVGELSDSLANEMAVEIKAFMKDVQELDLYVIIAAFMDINSNMMVDFVYKNDAATGVKIPRDFYEFTEIICQKTFLGCYYKVRILL